MTSPTDDQDLTSACNQLELSASQASNSIRDFVLYYPAARQDVGPMSRELADVQLAAQLLARNGGTLEEPSPALPQNVSQSIRAMVLTGIDLVKETVETIERPDETVNDRAARLQRAAENLVDFLRRVETLRIALNLALDTVLFAVNQGNPDPTTGLPPYPGSQPQASQPELPPYQSSQLLQTVGNLRSRLGLHDGDASAERQRPAMLEFLDNVRQFMEQSSTSLLVPPADGNAGSTGTPSLHSVAVAPTIDVTNPAPTQISLDHVSKTVVNTEEIIEVVGFRRNGIHAFAITSLDPPSRCYDIHGKNVSMPSWANHAILFHMVFADDGQTWAYAYDLSFDLKKFKTTETIHLRQPVLQVSDHITGGRKHMMRWVTPLAISSNASFIAVLSKRDRIIVYDLNSNACTAVITVHVDDVVAGIFTPDGQMLVTASRAGTILVSDPRTGETVAKLDCNTHKKFFHLGVTPDSSIVVSVWGDTVNRWNWLTSDLDAYSLSLRRGREGRPIAISPDCRFLACTNTDGIDVSDLHTGRLLHAIRFQTGIVTAAAFSVDGTYLALGKVGYVNLRAMSKPTLDVWNLIF